MERCILILRNLLDLTVEFRCRSLINAASVGQSALSDSLYDTEYTYSIDVGGVFRSVKTDLHMALRCEVVNFRWLNLADKSDETHRVAHVGIVQMEIRKTFEVSDALTIVD